MINFSEICPMFFVVPNNFSENRFDAGLISCFIFS